MYTLVCVMKSYCYEVLTLLSGVLPDWSAVVSGSALMLTRGTESVTISATIRPGHAVPFPLMCIIFLQGDKRCLYNTRDWLLATRERAPH